MSTLWSNFRPTCGAAITGGENQLRNETGITLEYGNPKTITVTKESGEWPTKSGESTLYIKYDNTKVLLSIGSNCTLGDYFDGKKIITPNESVTSFILELESSDPKQGDPNATVTVGDEGEGPC